jgi:hypothetical protein
MTTSVNEYLAKKREVPILRKRQELHDSVKYQLELEAKRMDEAFKSEFERNYYLQTQYSSKVYSPDRDSLTHKAVKNGDVGMLRLLDMTRKSDADPIQLAMIDMVQ